MPSSAGTFGAEGPAGPWDLSTATTRRAPRGSPPSSGAVACGLPSRAPGRTEARGPVAALPASEGAPTNGVEGPDPADASVRAEQAARRDAEASAARLQAMVAGLNAVVWERDPGHAAGAGSSTSGPRSSSATPPSSGWPTRTCGRASSTRTTATAALRRGARGRPPTATTSPSPTGRGPPTAGGCGCSTWCTWPGTTTGGRRPARGAHRRHRAASGGSRPPRCWPPPAGC